MNAIDPLKGVRGRRAEPPVCWPQRLARRGVLVLPLWLAACAQLPAPVPVPHEVTEAPLTAPADAAAMPDALDADAAARLALQRHPALRAAQAAYRAEQSEAAQRLRPANPAISVARQRSTGDGHTEWETEWGLHLPLGQWLAVWLRRDELLQASEHQQTQAQAEWLLQLDQHARAARRAWWQAVAAGQALRDTEALNEAAQTAAELARRLHAVGNFSKLQWLRWEQALAQQQLQLAQLQEQAQMARAQLAQQLGLWVPQDLDRLNLPDTLPALPETAPSGVVTEAEAVAQRLDLRVARAAQVRQLAAQGLAEPERWLSGVQVLLEAGRSPEARTRRLELEWPLPLFDTGSGRRGALQARAEAAAWSLQAQAQAVRAQVREAESALQHAWDRARHHQQRLLPLQQQISEEMLLRWNGMLEGPFELLRDAQARLSAQRAATLATRDYWLAWERARQVRWSPPDGRPGSSSLEPSGAAAPAPADPH